MTADSVDTVIRQAIGGDPGAISWILRQADVTESAVVLAMAALLERLPGRLDRARDAAGTNRDRQVVELARAHLDGKSELVDALARDHLADYPDSLIVAWIASDAVRAQLLEARRPTEIELITGSLIREAERLGVPVPLHTTLYRLIKAKEDGYLESKGRQE